MSERVWIFPATMLRVIDGDTVRVKLTLGSEYEEIDLGFHIFVPVEGHHSVNLRLEGVDAPELFRGDERDKGLLAKNELYDLFTEHGPHWSVTTDKDRRTFNRYIAKSIVNDRGFDIVSEMQARYPEEEE